MPTPPPPLASRITTLNAKAMAARSVAARRFRVAAAEERARAERERVGAVVDAIMTAADQPAPAADYVSRRLARVRAQLDRIDELIAEAAAGRADRIDGRKLNDLAAAQARLATQEQQLAGRPLPGSRRPGKDRSRPSGGAAAEVEPLD